MPGTPFYIRVGSRSRSPAHRRARAGQRLALKLKLPATGRAPLRAALRAHRRTVASVKISATSAGGEATVAKRKVRVTA